MKKITVFKRPQLATLRRELDLELKQLGARLGLNISSGNISYETRAKLFQF